jgi:Methylase involved in ubiquinone/menaquinone biosynthesis
MSGAPMIFDRALIRARQDRARRLGPVTFLLERVTQDLAERLGAVVRHFEVAVDLGTPTADLRRALANNPAIGLLIAASSNAQSAGLALVANEEALPFADASLDLVVSALALQTVNDLPGTLVQIRRALSRMGCCWRRSLGANAARAAPKLCRGRVGDRRRGFAARCSVCGRTRDRSAAAACRVCASGDRRRSCHGAVCLGARPDARPAPDGGDQRAD